VVTEGAIIGLADSAAGAGLGLAAAAEFTGQHPAGLYLIAAAAVQRGPWSRRAPPCCRPRPCGACLPRTCSPRS